MDVGLYWARLKGLPRHYLASLDAIGAHLGVYVATKPSWQDMINGSPPVTCVQIAKKASLLHEIELDQSSSPGDAPPYILKVEYRDLHMLCDHCGQAGHCHRRCAGEKLVQASLSADSWAKVVQVERSLPARQRERATLQEEGDRRRPIEKGGLSPVRRRRQADQRLLEMWFPGAGEANRVTVKVYVALQREGQNGAKMWMSQDRYHRHFPVTTLDLDRLRGKTKRQQEAVAWDGIKEILQAVCRGIQALTLEA